jgi:hypothetical protein
MAKQDEERPRPTKGEQPGFDQQHAKIRRDKGVEIRPAGKGSGNKQY